MALPDVKFSNDLGSLTFKRCLIGVATQYQWNGRSVKKSKSIKIDGTLLRDSSSPEYYELILGNPRVSGMSHGGPGTLTLPWTDLKGVRINSLVMPESAWLDSQKIQAEFVDDFPAENIYTIHCLGMELHAPRLSYSMPTPSLNDEYPQMPLVLTGSYEHVDVVGTGVMRTKIAQNTIQLNISGTVEISEGKLPEGWEKSVMHMADSPDVAAAIPAGYPKPFNLGDVVPELKDDLNLAHCIIVGGQMVWDVEGDVAQFQVEIIAPPQKMVVTP